MIDIYSFFNSPDVEKHCRNIEHKFSTLESTAIISWKHNLTLAEKHAAYRTIIAEYPDIEIPHKQIKSFHQELALLIDYEEQVLNRFMMPEPKAVYSASANHKGYHPNRDGWDYPGNWDDSYSIFTTYEKAYTDILDVVKYGKEYESSDYYSLTIKKRLLDFDKSIQVTASLAGEIIDIMEFDFVDIKRSNEFIDVIGSYIDVPVPFKPGDLVEHTRPKGGVFVLEYINKDKYPEQHLELLRDGFNWQMQAFGYTASYGSLSLYSTEICDYPNLQYCRRELEGEERILEYISLYMKKELPLSELLNMQKYLLVDKTWRNLRGSYDAITRNLEKKEIDVY